MINNPTIITKICSKCGLGLPIKNFGKDKYSDDGLTYQCKDCKNGKSKEYYIKNSDKILLHKKIHHQENREKDNLKSKEWRKNHPDKVREVNKKQYKRLIIREKNDIILHLIRTLRKRNCRVIRQKSFRKISKFKNYIGCSLEELKLHLKKQFQSSMTWDNHGFGDDKWHIDHIVALDLCQIYNLDKTLNIELSTKRLFELCHYTNLQPMWQPDNISKSNKIL